MTGLSFDLTAEAFDRDGFYRTGDVNQRRVLACRAALAETLYADPVPDGVVVAGTTP